MKEEKEYIEFIYHTLHHYYGEPVPTLTFTNNEELAIAVILSAQTNDNQVNKVTPVLFTRYPDLFSLAKAELKDVEKIIFSTGFYKNKSKNIISFAKQVVEKYNGIIPDDFDALVKLPGVGRKTANVIMNCAFNQSAGVVVDTHVKRVSNRLALSRDSRVEKIEQELLSCLPEYMLIHISLYFIFLGREFCTARKPDCRICILNAQCRFKDNIYKKERPEY